MDRQFVEREVKVALSEAKGFPLALLESVQTHPRLNQFIDGLTIQLGGALSAHVARGRKPIGMKVVKEYIHEMTILMVGALKREYDRLYETEMTKKKREQEESFKKDLENMEKGDITGVVDDMVHEGLKIGDTKNHEDVKKIVTEEQLEMDVRKALQ